MLHVATADGASSTLQARAVIDCLGHLDTRPTRLGAHGLPAIGERGAGRRASPTASPTCSAPNARATPASATLVVGAGHSALNAVLDLAALAEQEPGTRILWAVAARRARRAFGGGATTRWRQRGALGARAQALVDSGAVRARAGFAIDRIATPADALAVIGAAEGRAAAVAGRRASSSPPGFRPDLACCASCGSASTRRWRRRPRSAPLIDPNLHSCGTVRPHGVDELRHPEPGFYIVGMKSYGRAPTFLLLTGYEQVRSVAAALAGDWEAARRCGAGAARDRRLLRAGGGG